MHVKDFCIWVILAHVLIVRVRDRFMRERVAKTDKCTQTWIRPTDQYRPQH